MDVGLVGGTATLCAEPLQSGRIPADIQMFHRASTRPARTIPCNIWMSNPLGTVVVAGKCRNSRIFQLGTHYCVIVVTRVNEQLHGGPCPRSTSVRLRNSKLCRIGRGELVGLTGDQT